MPIEDAAVVYRIYCSVGPNLLGRSLAQLWLAFLPVAALTRTASGEFYTDSKQN